jgi:hypothetical protein
MKLRALAIAALAGLGWLGAGSAAAQEPHETATTTVITHADRAAFEPDRRQLRALFTLRVTVWPDGQPVRVFVLPDRAELHDQFVRERLGTYPYVLRSVWDRKVYTGVGLAPVEVRTEAEMREKVRSTPGAIGYARDGSKSFVFDVLHDLAAQTPGRADG